MHLDELESSCEALNLMAEAIHTSHVFPPGGGRFVDKLGHLRCYNCGCNMLEISGVIK